MVGNVPDVQFRAERGLTQLGMGEPQIIVPLGHMVGKLVGEAQPQAEGRAVRTDQVDAGQFGLLAAILRKGGHGEGIAGRDQLRAVALVEPFGLLADLAPGGLAALDAFQEHAHRIGLLLDRRRLAVHLVAAFRRAEMGQAGACHHQMRRIGMIDRRQDMAGRQFGGEVDAVSGAAGAHRVRQALPGFDRAGGERMDAFDTGHDGGAVAFCDDYRAGAVGRTVLQQADGHGLPLTGIARRRCGRDEWS